MRALQRAQPLALAALPWETEGLEATALALAVADAEGASAAMDVLTCSGFRRRAEPRARHSLADTAARCALAITCLRSGSCCAASRSGLMRPLRDVSAWGATWGEITLAQAAIQGNPAIDINSHLQFAQNTQIDLQIIDFKN